MGCIRAVWWQTDGMGWMVTGKKGEGLGDHGEQGRRRQPLPAGGGGNGQQKHETHTRLFLRLCVEDE